MSLVVPNVPLQPDACCFGVWLLHVVAAGGAYKNPPDHVAKLLYRELTTTFAGCFEVVCVAILDDHLGANFLPFFRAFGGAEEAEWHNK